MTIINFKPVASFRCDDHKAVLASTANLKKTDKALGAEEDAIEKSMANDESTDPNLASRLTDLLAGRKPAVPTPWDVRLREVKIKRRDNNDDLDFLSAKEKRFQIEAERKMVEDARPQIVAAEKAMWDEFVVLFDKFAPVWQAKRALHNNSIRSYDLFANSFEEFLGVPVDPNSAWAELFREGVAAGHIARMPVALRPKS